MSDENFAILIDVEMNHVGRVLRLLDTTQGIVNIHLKMRQEPPKPRIGRPPNALRQQLATLAPPVPGTPGRKPAPHQSTVDLIGRALMQGGALHQRILKEVLRRAGYSPHNVYKPLNALIVKKMVKRVAAGTYRLTEKGERRFSSNPQVKQENNDDRRGRLKQRLLQWTMERINHKDLMNKIVEHGYAKNNLYTKVPVLIEDGLIVRVGDDYELTDAGRNVLEALSVEHDDHTVENVTNG